MTASIEALHRLRLSLRDAHYGGGVVAGGRLLELIGDVATELCIRTDGDEGLLAGYDSVRFLRPAFAGDLIEVRGRVTRIGETSRSMSFEVLRYARPAPEVSDSAADLLDEPELIADATCTCVVKRDRQRDTRGVVHEES